MKQFMVPAPIKRTFLMTIVLVGCLSFPPASAQEVTKGEGISYAWIGTTLWPRGVAKMRLEYQLFGHNLQGEYAVGCSSTSSLRNCVSSGRGFITGTVENGVLHAQLKVGDECVYTLLGTVTADKLVAKITPTDCPGGSKGEWALRKG